MAVFKRGPIYWFHFTFRGRRIQESTGFTNRAAALRAESARKMALLERRAGFSRPEPAPRFDDYVDEFLKWSKEQHRPKTHELHKLNCKALRRFFRGKYVDDITRDMVEEFKSTRKQERIQWARNRTVSGATVNRALTTLKLLLNLALRSGHIIRNPVVGVSMYQESADSMRVITFDEQVRYLAAASQPLRDVATVMLGTGMRPEEVRHMKVENINFEQKTIFIPSGKTKAARRTIPMTDDVRQLLKGRVKEAEELKSPYVFSMARNSQRPIGSVKKAHRAARERAKIEGPFRLYDLRHTFATNTAASGTDLPTLSSLLGHTTIQMTMRYVHPAAEQKRIAIEKLEKYQANGVIDAAAARQIQGVTTKSATVEKPN